MQVTTDAEHKFELSLQLDLLDDAYKLAVAADSELKWKQVGDYALTKWNVGMAEECLASAHDLSGLMLVYHATGNRDGLARVADMAASTQQNNMAFLSAFVANDTQKCLQLLSGPEAAFFSRTFMDNNSMQAAAEQWKQSVHQEGMGKIARAIATPVE